MQGTHALKFARGHDHSVDVLAIEHPAIILAERTFQAVGLHAGLGARQVAIGHRDDLCRRGELPEQKACAAAHANRANADAVVGPRSTRGRKG